MSRSRFTVPVALVVAGVAVLWALQTVRAVEKSGAPATNVGRFSVASQVLPGQVSITVLYVTDSQTNKLYIYRAIGTLDTSYNQDPVLYRTYDLSSSGQKTLQQAK